MSGLGSGQRLEDNWPGKPKAVYRTQAGPRHSQSTHMTDIRAAQRRIEKMLRRTFTVENVAEPLLSFDEELPSCRALQVLERHRFVVAGERESGARHRLRARVGSALARVRRGKRR